AWSAPGRTGGRPGTLVASVGSSPLRAQHARGCAPGAAAGDSRRGPRAGRRRSRARRQLPDGARGNAEARARAAPAPALSLVRTVAPRLFLRAMSARPGEGAGAAGPSGRRGHARPPAPAADPERYEAWETVSGRRLRLLATAATLGAARFAARTLAEEAGPGAAALGIRDASSGRWPPGRRAGPIGPGRALPQRGGSGGSDPSGGRAQRAGAADRRRLCPPRARRGGWRAAFRSSPSSVSRS